MNQCNLKGIYNELWIALETAIVDRKSGFHTFSLATVNNEFADNRTVVLRGCNKDKMILSMCSGQHLALLDPGLQPRQQVPGSP